MPRLSRPVATAALLAALGAGAGCGGSEPSSGSGPVATAPAGGAVTGSLPPPSGSAATAAPGTIVVAPGGQLTVLAPLGLNLRSGPSTDAAVVGNLGVGATVTVIAHQAGWYQVKGQTHEGYVTDDPRYVSGRHFNRFTSTSKSFGVLYPDTWTFTEGNADVRLQPQSGGASLMVIAVGATLDALGPAGEPGYGVSSIDTVEVYGVTGTQRTLDRGAVAPATTTAPIGGAPAPAASAAPTGAAHVLEVRLTVTPTYAMRIDAGYTTPDELAVLHDMLSSMTIAAANPTPTPSPAGPAPPGAPATP